MAEQQIGIVIKVDGSVETANGIRLTAQQIDTLGQGLTRASAAMRGYEQQQGSVVSQTATLTRSQASLLARLKDEADTVGLNAAQLALYRAQQAGLQGENLRVAASYVTKIQAIKDEQEALRAAAAEQQQLTKTGIATAAALGTAAVSALTSVYENLKRKFDDLVATGDKLAGLADKLKLPVERLNALKFVAQQSDTDFETFTRGYERLQRALVDGQRNVGNAAAAFRALQLDPNQFTSTEQLLVALAERFQRIEDPAIKAALAQRFFGQSGAELINLLSQGPQVLQRLTAEGESLSRVTAQNAADATLFKNEMARLSFQQAELSRSMLSGILPTMNKFLQQLIEGQKIAGGFARALLLFGTAPAYSNEALQKSIKSVQEYEQAIKNVQEGTSRFIPKGDPNALKRLNEEMATAVKLRDFYKLQQRQENDARLRDLGVDLNNNPEVRRFQPRPFTVDVNALNSEGSARGTRGRTERDDLPARIQKSEEASLLGQQERLDEIQSLQFAEAKRILAERKNDAAQAAAQAKREEEEQARELARLRQEEDRAAQRRFELQSRDLEQRRKRADQLTLEVDGQAAYNKKVDELNVLLAQGEISMDVFAKQVAKADKELENFSKKGDDAFKGLENVIRSTASKSTDALLSFFDRSGDKLVKLRDLAATVFRDIARYALQQNVTEPLTKGASSLLQSGVSALANYFAPGSGGAPATTEALGSGLRLRQSSATGAAPSAIGAGMNLNFTINASAEGGSGGRDNATQFGQQLVDTIRPIVKQEILRESRPGGVLATVQR
jgi:hypothetical protein